MGPILVSQWAPLWLSNGYIGTVTPMNPIDSDKSKRRVTLKVLAQHLGLSRTTISIVLNDAPQAKTISVQTRQRILQAAKDFNYRPNFLARSLNDGRSYLIGIISPDLSEGYTSGLLAGIEQFLLGTEYQFFIASHHWSEMRIQRTATLFAERSVEGIIIINTPYQFESNVPTVQIGRQLVEPTGTLLTVDNHLGVLRAMRHLVDLGHHRIAFIRGHKDSVDSEDRWDAVLETAQQLSVTIDPALVVRLERLDVFSLSAMEEGARCAEQLMDHRGEFTALMAFNDMSAIGAIARLRDAGWSIPSEVSVVGFDDILEARISYPALTTIQQPLRTMGETAASELISAILHGYNRQTIVFSPNLIIRDSTAQARTVTKRYQRQVPRISAD